jgi:hypothetical protein
MSQLRTSLPDAECPIAQECWQALLLHIPQILTPFKVLVDLSMRIIILMAWSIWQVRNDCIFRQQQVSLNSAMS